jgi:hypothetical protein
MDHLRRPSPASGDPKEELAAAAQSAAKRAHALTMLSDSRNAPDNFRRAAQRACELLEDAARSVVHPEYRIRGLATGREVASAMTSVNEPHANQVLPPMQLMREQNSMSVLSGSTKAVPVPELLEFLGLLRKTGILWINAAGESFTFQFEEGYLVHACSSSSPPGSRLGDILVESGHVTQEKLDGFLASFSRFEGKLGCALERSGLVTPEQLTDALERQVQLLFCRLFAIENASFSFAERKANNSENRLRLGIVHLLLEGARAHDERR